MKIDIRIIALTIGLVFLSFTSAFGQNEEKIETTKDFKTLLTFYRGAYRKGGNMWQHHWNRRVPRDYTSMIGSMVKLAPRIDVRNIKVAETETSCTVDYRMVVINKWDDTKLNWIYSVESSGKDSLEAVENASQKHIVESDIVYHDFVNFFEHYIDSNFVKKCSDFIDGAKIRIEKEKLGNALQYLQPITSNSDCHDEATLMRTDLKAKIAKKKCEDILTQTRKEIDENEYFHAMNTLHKIDLKSVCEKDARDLWKDFLKKMDSRELKNHEIHERERVNKKFDAKE